MLNRKQFISKASFLLIIALMLSFQGFNASDFNKKVGLNLSKVMNIAGENEQFLIWVTFKDKGVNIEDKLANPESFLTQKSIERRQKVRGGNTIADVGDLPVNGEYIDGIKETGIEIKNVSKWFNSISCYATMVQIEQISTKDYVHEIEPVAKFKKDSHFDNPAELKSAGKENTTLTQSDNANSLNYGLSLQQSRIINVPTAHDSGYTGKGILIASFDSGFDNLSHPCFDSIRARGLRTYDFVNGDTNVANEPGQMGTGGHGTRTLSLAVGYAPGDLISPAFDSKVILAKTENTDSETPLEEDNWIAAAEWADSLGADIITSSLTYIGFDSGSAYSYDWTWMNGDSCKITKAADLMVGKGIIIVNSAGNYGNDTHNTLGAPADGDSVFTIGSINFTGERSSFSSVGPTIDGRIKPDLMAVGSGNVTASTGQGNTGYTSFGSGTSFSCPMVAGVCAMILSAKPNLTPMEVLNILRSTASNSQNPNSLIGWGTVDAWGAIQVALNTSGISSNSSLVEGYALGQNYPNPFNPVTVIPFELQKSSVVSIKVYDIDGREVANLVNNQRYIGGTYSVQFSASNFGLSSGAYFYALSVDGLRVDSKKMVLLK